MVPVGRQLPLTSGSAARIFAAFEDIDIENATFSVEDVERARSNGYSESIEEREAGLASISAPVFDPSGTLVAVISVSGSAERFRPSPSEKYAPLLADAAQKLTARL